MSFADRTVLITGAAGHLGRAVAAHFERAGARRVLIDRQADALHATFGASRRAGAGRKGVSERS
jgi:NAD(P)-dependent dehydrogenase (short-subunit alcohol dehydrogenase family)